MPNTYFQFKQFTIHQEHCAMKVCTDACVLGAWFSTRIAPYSTVLDIGSGTGLLMMMLAQRSQAVINGIEIDADCYKQLQENISQNEWKERLTVFHGDVRSYTLPQQYDFIISNPPFFENDLQGNNTKEQVAKHSTQLTLNELIRIIDSHLKPGGSFGILLPYHRWEYFNQLATQANFYLTERLLVKQSPKHNYFRAILQYSKSPAATTAAIELTIQQEDRSYTTDFTALMKDYYLHL
jgi:tRNA1Val (adenine37-N6)-methyltransferase